MVNFDTNIFCVLQDQDFEPTVVPPIEKPPPPPVTNSADGGKELDDSEVDKQGCQQPSIELLEI